MVAASILVSLLPYSAKAMELLVPEDQSLFQEEFVTVVVDVAGESLERVEIVAENNQSYTIAMVPDKEVYCKTVRLKLGDNNLTVNSYTGAKKRGQKHLQLYRSSYVEKAFKYPPGEYRQTFLHTEKKERACAKCHDMRVNEVKNVAFEDVTDSNCYSCHRELSERKSNHAPAVNWLCTSCHNGKTGIRNAKLEGRSKYTFADPVGESCLACHEKHKKLWEEKLYHHNPAEAGRCNRCHNPHSSDNEFDLRKPTWELCVGCHADKAEGMHVANISFIRTKHPTKGVPNPSRPGKELNCASCHSPHASNKRFFLPDNLGNKMICTMCHKK